MTLSSDRLPPGHIEAAEPEVDIVGGGRLGPLGWLRWIWRQLTAMPTALMLLLLLALAAVPGSIVPQLQADPNGVAQYKIDHPTLYPILDKLQVFNTFSSVWFSAIYLLLFVSLIGCIIPRTAHHWRAMRAAPPKTPFRLNRMVGYSTVQAPEGVTVDAAMDAARSLLKSSGYRVTRLEERDGASVSAERGYLRETGNLVFHIALVGMLLAIGIGSGFEYTGQRIVTTGQTFVNSGINYDTINPGRFVDLADLPDYSVKLHKLNVDYDDNNPAALGQPLNYVAHVTAQKYHGKPFNTVIKVNHPLVIDGSSVYLLGNGYAPVLVFRNPQGKVVLGKKEATPFLAEDSNLTSHGVIKLPDGLPKQVGILGVFMPTAPKDKNAQPVSTYPGLKNPRVSLTVYDGNLGLNDGIPVSVYTLPTDHLTQVAGPEAKTPGINIGIGQTAQLPDGLGSVTFEGVRRFASLDIHHDPSQGWMLVFAALVVLGLLTSLFVPRRRMWVRARRDAAGGVVLEYAGLARGEDPRLDDAVDALAARHLSQLMGTKA